MVRNRRIAPSIVLIGDQLCAKVVINRDNISQRISLEPEYVPIILLSNSIIHPLCTDVNKNLGKMPKTVQNAHSGCASRFLMNGENGRERELRAALARGFFILQRGKMGILAGERFV